jgi:hypothetical protein
MWRRDGGEGSDSGADAMCVVVLPRLPGGEGLSHRQQVSIDPACAVSDEVVAGGPLEQRIDPVQLIEQRLLAARQARRRFGGDGQNRHRAPEACLERASQRRPHPVGEIEKISEPPEAEEARDKHHYVIVQHHPARPFTPSAGAPASRQTRRLIRIDFKCKRRPW